MMSLVAHRKICKSCKCSQEDHCLSSDVEDDRKIGRLLSDSKYVTLTARVKGGDGVRIYKRNRMIITNPIVSRKDPTFDTITYEWAPPGLTQKLVREQQLVPAGHSSALQHSCQEEQQSLANMLVMLSVVENCVNIQSR